jgi:autotransporter-associated beta strand protein
MRIFPVFPFVVGTGFLNLAAPCGVEAATQQFWNPGGTGGDGVWGTGPADLSWNNAVGAATPNYAWPNTSEDVANFQDAFGGTATIFGEVSAAGLRQSGAGYTIEGGTLRLITGSGGEQPFIAVETGTLAVTATLAGTVGLTKTGAGTLTLSGFNTFTGPTVIDAGTLVLAGPDQLPDGGSLTIAASGTLALSAGTESVASLVSNGGTIDGAGTLVATSYQLNGGSTVNANLGAGILTTSGAVALNGTAAAATVNVGSGALSLSGGNLADDAALTLAAGGGLVMNGSDTVGSLVSNGGSISGPGTLSAASYVLGDGSSVSGNLGSGVLTSNGAVSLSGSSAAATVNISSGTLGLDGDNLSDIAAVGLGAGADLLLGGSDTVGSLVSNGGSISGPGTLTAASYVLNGGTHVNGTLGTGMLESHGVVESSGTIGSSTIRIGDGTFINTGTLGTAASLIDIAGGATLVAGGTQNFARLTTSGGGVGTWVSNLANAGTVAPGGDAAAGTLRVTGDFTNTGILSLDVGITGYDLLQVVGTATFGGVLEINRLGLEEIEAMVPLQVVEANFYAGSFSALNENLEGVVFFNPANGTITRLGFDDGAALLGRSTPNQASTWIALYDDVIDPGSRNAFYRPGQSPPYTVTSGIASPAEPDLLGALQASITPAGLDAALLNRLSPEVYGSLSDYSLQALRNHHRTARSAPALAAGGLEPTLVPMSRGAKGAELVTPSPASHAWEIFAAADYVDVGTDGSLGQADYDLRGAGVVAGGRYSLDRRVRISAWLAGNDGRVSGDLIDADARGFAIGLGGEALIPASNRELRLSAGISYGSWEFDGTRGSAVATGAGWTPGFASFQDTEADAFEAFVGIDSVAWCNEHVRIIPSLGLVYSSASSDAFREGQGGIGSPIALVVDGVGRDSLAAQLGLAATAEVTRFLTLDGETGMQVALTEETERLSGRFASGARPMAAILTPLSDDLFYVGAGATWNASDTWKVRLGYRAEFRSDADLLSAINLSTSLRF